MNINVKYFGIIAETVGKSEEVLDLEEKLSAQELKNWLVQKYSIADSEAIQLAVNQNLDTQVELKEGDEVAFLPPFAGG